MPIVAFYTVGEQEAGNTVSAIALSTYIGITKNKKNILISTSLNNKTIEESLWPAVQVKKKSGLFGPNTSEVAQNGVEGLDRIIRSNKISPDIITDYTRVALKGRLEVLTGYKGIEEQYEILQQQYPQIVSMASKCYDTVFVDIDKKLSPKIQSDIINLSTVVIVTTTQKVANLNNTIKKIQNEEVLKKYNTLITLTKYDSNLKYNAKNISRNILRQKKVINTIPYNSLMYEAVQEGQIIDLLYRLSTLKENDENKFLIDELKRLEEDIENKKIEIQMKS